MRMKKNCLWLHDAIVILFENFQFSERQSQAPFSLGESFNNETLGGTAETRLTTTG